MSTRIVNTCLTLLRSRDTTTHYCVLIWMEENLQLLVKSSEFVTSLSENSHLLSTFNPEALCNIRLQLKCLTPVITDTNVQQVTANISGFLKTGGISHHASNLCIHFLSHDLLGVYPDAAKELLLDIMEVGTSATDLSLLSSLLTFTQYEEVKVESLFSRLIVLWREMKELELVTLLTLCGCHAHKSSDYLTHMSDMCDFVTSSTSRSQKVKSLVTTVIRCALLAALVKCFKHQPVEYKNLLIQALSSCEETHAGSSVILQEQVIWCHKKLRQLQAV